MPDADYLALRAKVDRFAGDVAERHELSCRAGCSGCCQVQLELCDVEAEALTETIASLPASTRERLRARTDEAGNACVLLDRDGRCAAYEGRPLVCRSQGLPLRYPAGVVPADAVMGRAGDADVTWCPLNFADIGPGKADVLDAERVDLVLAVINRRHAGDERALARRSIREIVRAASQDADCQPD